MPFLHSSTLPLTPAAALAPAGLVAGSTILTRAGALPVEYLVAGEQVITRDSGMATLLEVQVREIETAVIRVRAGALSHACPEHDMRAGAGTLVLLRDWRAAALYGAPSAMVPLSRLCDGYYITPMAPRRIRLYALQFARPHVIYADGVEIGSGTGA